MLKNDRVDQFNRVFLLRALTSRRSSPRGATLKRRPESDHDERDLDFDLKPEVAFSAQKMEMFQDRSSWSEERIINALGEGAFFDQEMLKGIRPGIRAFEAGRHWEALHLLVPQIDRVIRNLAKRVGAETFRYESSTGDLHWTSLKTLLAEPAVVQVLGMIRPELAQELGLLLVDSRGWNLREDLAHGVLPSDADAEGLSFLCVVIVLTLSTLVRRDRVRETAPVAPVRAAEPEPEADSRPTRR
jgi:hypothetical protein